MLGMIAAVIFSIIVAEGYKKMIKEQVREALKEEKEKK